MAGVAGVHTLAVLVGVLQFREKTRLQPKSISVAIVQTQGAGAGKAGSRQRSVSRSIARQDAQLRLKATKVSTPQRTMQVPPKPASSPAHVGMSTQPLLLQKPVLPPVPNQAIAETPASPSAIDPAANISDAAIIAIVASLTGTETASDIVPKNGINETLEVGTEVGSAGVTGQGLDDGCTIAAQLQQAFTDEAPVRAAIYAIPVNERSVANAIQLWNGEWISTIGKDVLADLRQSVDTIVNSSTPECRNAMRIGPVFFIATDEDKIQTVIVLGSGQWRWTDLVTPPTRQQWFWPPLFSSHRP